VDFTSSVDDTGTADAPTSTTEGNGDGDAGDANTWTVTTTDGAGAADHVYYSIGTSTADLKTGSPNITIASGTATLTVAQTGNIGVGDMIDYDVDNKIAYIKSLTSQTEFVVHTATGAAPANITGKTVNSIKRAFNALGTAESGSTDASHLNTADLTATGAAVKLTWVAYDDGDFTSNVAIDGYTTDATYFITLTVAGAADVASGVSQRHDGTAGSGVLFDGANLTSGVAINDDYTQFEWFEIIRTGGANGRPAVGVENASNVILDHLLIHNYTTGLASYGIKGADNSSFTARNCIIYDGQSTGIRLNGTPSTATVQNCTVYGITGTGISQDAGTLTVTNSISMGNTTDFSGGTQSYNMSSDATATGTGSLINKVTADQFVSITGGSEDLHLKAGSDAINVGTDLSGSFTHDIDADSRPIGAQWDIGADETSASAGPPATAHWPFDEGSGQTAADATATNNDGTLGPTASVESADPSWICVAGGNALDFDGTNDQEVKLSSVNIGNSAAWSITAWIKMSEYLLFYVDDTSNHIKFYSVEDGGANYALFEGTTNVEDDAWHLVTIVQRSKTDRELYVGTNSEATNTQNAGTYTFDTASIGFLRASSWTADPFKGSIDDVRFYNYALSTSEIAALNSSPPGACGTNNAVTSALAEISPNDVTTSSTGNSFSYDIQATIKATRALIESRSRCPEVSAHRRSPACRSTELALPIPTIPPATRSVST
jgi:hypothetical protein